MASSAVGLAETDDDAGGSLHPGADGGLDLHRHRRGHVEDAKWMVKAPDDFKLLRTPGFSLDAEIERLGDKLENVFFLAPISVLCLAGQIKRGFGFGLIGNVIVGIIGSLMESRLFSVLHISLGAGVVGTIITSVIGALVVLSLIGLIRKG